MFTVFSIPIGSTHVSADDPPVTTTPSIGIGSVVTALGPIPTSIEITIPPLTTKPPKPPKPGPTTTTRPPLPTTTVAVTTTSAPTTSTAPTSTQVAPTETTIGSPTPTTAVEVTIPVGGSVEVITTTSKHRSFPRVSTTTEGVEQIAPGLTVVTEPTTTSSAPTTSLVFALNIADLQQYEAPTVTTINIVGRAEVVHSSIVAQKKAESSGVNSQVIILLVIIGSLFVGTVVFVILAEHHLRNRRVLSRAKR